jgi:hypothetical protein
MFRFTIRELLFLNLVVALLFGWWVHYDSYRHRLRHCQDLLKQAWHDHEVCERKADYWQQEYETLKADGVK